MSAAAGSSTADPDADALAAAVLGVGGVTALSAGPLGQYRTYLRGRSVAGIRVEDTLVRVDVVVAWGEPFADVARDIDRALRPLIGGRALSVGVADVHPPTVEGHGDRG